MYSVCNSHNKYYHRDTCIYIAGISRGLSLRLGPYAYTYMKKLIWIFIIYILVCEIGMNHIFSGIFSPFSSIEVKYNLYLWGSNLAIFCIEAEAYFQTHFPEWEVKNNIHHGLNGLISPIVCINHCPQCRPLDIFGILQNYSWMSHRNHLIRMYCHIVYPMLWIMNDLDTLKEILHIFDCFTGYCGKLYKFTLSCSVH